MAAKAKPDEHNAVKDEGGQAASGAENSTRTGSTASSNAQSELSLASFFQQLKGRAETSKVVPSKARTKGAARQNTNTSSSSSPEAGKDEERETSSPMAEEKTGKEESFQVRYQISGMNNDLHRVVREAISKATPRSPAQEEQEMSSDEQERKALAELAPVNSTAPVPLEGIIRIVSTHATPADKRAEHSLRQRIKELRKRSKFKGADKSAITSTGHVSPKVSTPKHVSPEVSTPSAEGQTQSSGNIAGLSLRAALTGSTPAGVQSISASELEMTPLAIEQPPVPTLSHGLERVLFNPSVYQLQDPHSRVYNFDPYLQDIMPVTEFDFNLLKEYKTSSQDRTLAGIAQEHGLKYVGSTSSMTGTLGHFHYLLSNWRELNTDMLSQGFPEKLKSFTEINRAPNAIFLRWKNGTYAIDADKEYDSGNVMMLLGKSMEKLLTMSPSDFERYRKGDSRGITEEQRNEPESFHYTTYGDFLMRSQLDAYDPRLPGTGMFDLKTRAVISVRMQSRDFEDMSGYQIHHQHGRFESYEREYYDMMRSTMLKYSLQARMGRMDGIFVAYHNIKRIFGFQYLNMSEFDKALHGQYERYLGDQEFLVSIDLLNKALNKATERFPEQSIRFHFETRPAASTTFMYIFAEPVTEEEIDTIQSSQKARIAQFERDMMGVDREAASETPEPPTSTQPVSPDASEEAQTSETTADPNTLGEVVSDQQVWDSTSAQISRVLETDEMQSENKEPADEGSEVTAEGSSSAEDSESQPPLPAEQETAVASSNTSETNATPSTNTEDAASTASDPASTEDLSTTDSSADSSFLAQITRADELQKNLRPLLAMTLTVRSRVNGSYVERPTFLKATDKWRVEYVLREITPPQRAWALYEATKARRRKQMTKIMGSIEGDEASEDSVPAKPSYRDGFVERLRVLAAKGREWRSRVDEEERGREKVVLGQPVMHARERRVGEVREGEGEEEEEVRVEGVDDYLRWLWKR